jgi:hypothetical protein
MTEHPTEHALAWRRDQAARTDQIRRELRNAERSKRRRELYRKDPIWRLTKLKITANVGCVRNEQPTNARARSTNRG